MLVASDDQLDPQNLQNYFSVRKPFRPTIAPAAISRGGAMFDQGFSPDSDQGGSQWWSRPMDPAAFNVSSSGPEGTGRSGQPSVSTKAEAPSAAAGKVLNGGIPKMPPPGVDATAPYAPVAESGPMPPPAARATTPPPGVNAVDQLAADREDRKHQIADVTKRIVDRKPPELKSNWAQRLGMAVLASTKLAPYASQIVHPKWSQDMGAYQNAQKSDIDRVGTLEKAETADYLGEQRQATAEQRRQLGLKAASAADELERQHQEHEKIQHQAAFTRQLGKPEDLIENLAPGDPQIQQLKDQGWQLLDDIRYPEGSGIKVAKPPAAVQVTTENEAMLPGHKIGTLVPWSEYKSGLAEWQKTQRANTAAGGKPQTQEQNKLGFQGIIEKIAGENGIQPGALTDVRVLMPAIQGSKNLTPEEKSHAIAYLAANPTPAATGSNSVIRVEGMMQGREMPVLDTQNGNTPQFLNAAEINAANRQQPGRYLPAGVGVPALNKTALMEDIRGTVQQVRNSLANMPEFSPQDKTKIAVAMRSHDPKSAVSSLIQNATAGSMTPQMQEYLINHATLIENALAMRSVLGAGQGSDDMRAAISATVPGPTTPNKAYALKQLDSFEAVLNRLERGVPKVPLREGQGMGHGPAAGGTPQPKTYKATATGQNGHKIGSNDNGNTWFDVQTGQAVK